MLKIKIDKEKSLETGSLVFSGNNTESIELAFALLQALEKDKGNIELIDRIIFLLLDYFKANGAKEPFKELYEEFTENKKSLPSIYKEIGKRLEDDKKLIDIYKARDDLYPKYEKRIAQEKLRARGFIDSEKFKKELMEEIGYDL